MLRLVLRTMSGILEFSTPSKFVLLAAPAAKLQVPSTRNRPPVILFDWLGSSFFALGHFSSSFNYLWSTWVQSGR